GWGTRKRPGEEWILQLMAIANSTENALTMVNDEMKQLRDAVIQNRLVLDMLTSESGGICKMLGTSCCFHIPDYSDNITNIIAHMRMWKNSSA
uniref:ERVV2 protein n=1 Tax=Cyprinus carpio TaxID=7962 RepID=A0A8C1VCN4_CYPCA